MDESRKQNVEKPQSKTNYNYYEDNKKKVQIKNGKIIKLRQWVTRLTNLITLHPMERQRNRELLIKAYNEGGLKLTSEYASFRVSENEKFKAKEAEELNKAK